MTLNLIQVMQLDLVGFTALSAAAADPMELATTIHRLFCAFDVIVTARSLYKVPPPCLI
jgi:hypothetical protein